MSFVSFVKKIGKGLQAAAKRIFKSVTDRQIDVAIAIVKAASIKFTDNAERREWAVEKVQSELRLPESLARWLVETAVIQVKEEIAQLLDEAGEAVKKLND